MAACWHSERVGEIQATSNRKLQATGFREQERPIQIYVVLNIKEEHVIGVGGGKRAVLTVSSM